ncbi:extracellular solute-binding protein [Paenibacillus sp. LMG 31461]|uniref:Extracellular solute-binding protein n=1 Tax=Paenibacillus plantarum TaxID=2654975 RepID=A0ABX1X7Z7_9BACL|nr:extracellular solute-binding protein [Paenibacillus plantarum]NOU64570.1 extracellular solute-binding protein [Paenibacillus plantarum]
MQRNWKSRVPVLTISLVVVLALTACSKNNETMVSPDSKPSVGTVSNSKLVTIHMVMPGDQSSRMKAFLETEFAQKMKKELNLAFDITYTPWAQYYDKLNLMFASGEDLDLFWAIPSNFAQYVNKKNIMAVDKLLEENGPNILKYFPQENFDAVKLNGKMYALPVAKAPSAAKFHSLLVREDLLKEAGMAAIKSVQDISDFAAKVKAKHPEITPIFEVDPLSPYYRAFSPANVSLTPIGNAAYYYVNEDEKDGNVYSLFENVDLVKKISDMRADWRSKGYIKDNQLTNFGNALSEFNSGNYAMTSGAAGDRAVNFIGPLTKNVPTGELNEYLLNPEKPKYTQMVVTDMFYVAAQSKHADRAVQFLNWVFENQDNYDFMINGVKDKDYKNVGDKIEKLTTDELWPAWMLYNKKYAKFSTLIPDKTANSYKNWDVGTKLSKTAGFVFDNANVKLEETKVNQIIVEKINPILWGFLDFEGNFPAARKALKDAGIDKIRMEYEGQLKSYLSKK